jgi:hypothetical protein
MASYKIKEVERLIADQEWKMKHSANTSRLPMLATIGSVALELLISTARISITCHIFILASFHMYN